ncbi:Ger(x)C family spore germination protein [Sporosarcina jiandibaonis]|uniref:Ger(x)C family spore germination protein n=1 Tax=Sporosarcina jiandibaonis TaxID=2715535 RepID=UPI001556A1E0|nr:Ger(x)C family spore germination protein [Sporosarcina jiandibaonis]
MKRISLLVSLIPLLLLSSCGDKLELEQHAYAVVIGLDTNDEDDNLIDVTFQIANPQVGSTDTGAAANEPPSDIVTFTTPDLLSAKELANSVITRKISFDHLNTIIVGEKLAKTPLFHHIIASAMIDPEIRLENTLLVSKEKASDFIDANIPKLETRPHKYYFYMRQRWRDTGFVPLSDLNRYFQRLSGDLYLAIYATTEKNEEVRKNEDHYVAGQIPQKSGDPVQMMGSAVFKNGKMIGILTGEETRMSLLLRQKPLSHYAIQSFTDPINNDYRISTQIMMNGKTRVKIDASSDIPDIKVTVPIKVQVFSNPSLTNYTTNLKHQETLKQSIKNELEQIAKDLIQKTQEEFKAEPFLWYLEARRQFWTNHEYEKYNWSEKYSNANVDVKFDVKIESFGAQMKPEVIRDTGKD